MMFPRLCVSVALAGGLSLAFAGPGTAMAQGPAPTRVAASSNAVESVDPLLEQVDNAIEVTSRRFLSADVHTPWQIMHGVLALRQEFLLKKGDEKINALEWIATGPYYQNMPWIEITDYGGRFHRFTTPYAFEGHPNQFLAILTMAALPADYEFVTDGRKVTISDMVRNAQMDINTAEEVTWSLWALSFWLDPDARWTNKFGEPWSIERMVQIQTQAPVFNAACGGTHGLFALSRARNAHLQTGKPLRGVWIEADQKIQRYIETARQMQNPDGTFSANYFQGPQWSSDFNTRIATSGHTLEFLMMGLPQSRLNEQWVRRSVSALAKELIDNRKSAADCGPLYHALDALVIYRDRVRPVTEVVVKVPAPAPEPSAPVVSAPETGVPTLGDADPAAVPDPQDPSPEATFTPEADAAEASKADDDEEVGPIPQESIAD